MNIKNFFKLPLSQSLIAHLFFVVLFLFLSLKPRTQKIKIDFEVFEAPKVVEKTLNLEPPKVNKVKPPPPTPETKQVFGVSRKSITSSDISTNTAEVKTGNTVAKEQDTLKLDPTDQDSIPIPADEYLVSSMPVLISEVRIPYPEEAKKAGIEGPVVLELLIDNQGRVRSVTLIKGPGFGLNEAALAAIKNFKFRPAMMKDQSVAVKIKYTYRFVLENR
ncbi:MAG: TonB family protein [Bdellovibrionaceae bacterium]|nr:TonB family protein [Pseudobdellovibrionaceae bacterium]NUM58015.1 energy transducer TonB [Pseudobdellovibrionaceae bacterium]